MPTGVGCGERATPKQSSPQSFNQELKPFYDAFKAYDDLKAKCCTDNRIAISLVVLTAVPEGEEFSKQREIRRQEYENSKKRCEMHKESP